MNSPATLLTNGIVKAKFNARRSGHRPVYSGSDPLSDRRSVVDKRLLTAHRNRSNGSTDKLGKLKLHLHS
jgi:hypothetical protein